jgi:hypothetical protein
MARVRNHLQELEDKLDFVQPLADEIDRRTAEFTRRSLARSRYLQEVIGERRGQVKEVFEKIDQAFPGRRLVDLEELTGLPPLLLPNAKLLAGRDSLYEPPRRRTLEENARCDEVSEAADRPKHNSVALCASLTVLGPTASSLNFPGEGRAHRKQGLPSERRRRGRCRGAATPRESAEASIV